LNSSITCFWMKQVFYPKASITGDISIEKGRPEANRYAFNSTGLLSLPIPFTNKDDAAIRRICQRLVQTSNELNAVEPLELLHVWRTNESTSLSQLFSEVEKTHDRLRRRMVALQEELDWECYRTFGLCERGSDAALVEQNTIGIEPSDRPAFWPSEEP